MLITAIWVVEQQFAWSKRTFSFPKGNEGVFHIATSPFYAVTASVITASPYYGIYTMGSSLAYDAESTASRYRIARFYGRKVGKRRMAKLVAKKIAARFVPGLGVALLMADAWHVGKWIGKKTNPFD